MCAERLRSDLLDELYKSYGFKKARSGFEDINVYTLRSGHFNNAEIVPLEHEVNVNRVFEEFRNSGYACHEQHYSSLDEAETSLFEGFFALKITRDKFGEEYKDFYVKQTDALGVPYRYVSPPYKNDVGEDANHKEQPLVDKIVDDLKSSGSKLVILEAAAGYGKTCTSFEVLNRTLLDFGKKIPFFVELSRNRQAKIFRYVLLDEANRVFPGLKAELVESQIKSGRLILILDGFDELLHRAESLSSDFDEVEPMLETISDLLQGEAKIILTTRRTAIFSGDRFHQWMDNHSHEFHISRHSLSRPEITDWLSPDQLVKLKKNNFPINSLSNPVLLAYLAGQDNGDFDSLVDNPERLVDRYFSSLLEREKERQDLIMAPEEQYDIFKNLANSMVEEDFTSEDHEYIKIQIYERNFAKLQKVRKRYPSERKPTVEDLASKLVSHALMDRKSEEDDKVSFINDFVMGNFVGEVAATSPSDEWIAAENFIDKAVLAFSSRSSQKKSELWEKLNFALQILPAEQRLMAEISLCGHPNTDLSNSTINSVSIDSTVIGYGGDICDTVFCGSVFSDVTFNLDVMHNVGFVGCSFYSCRFEFDKDMILDNGIYVSGCDGDLTEIKSALFTNDVELDTASTEFDEYELAVLQQFWPKGRPHLSHKRMTSTLFRGHANSDRLSVTRAIERLQNKSLIVVTGETAEINGDRIGEIREILGRGDS